MHNLAIFEHDPTIYDKNIATFMLQLFCDKNIIFDEKTIPS